MYEHDDKVLLMQGTYRLGSLEILVASLDLVI
jgi:hypothetical protein